MLDAGAAVAPFNVDPLGDLGPTAHSLLFGKHNCPLPSRPTHISFAHPHAHRNCCLCKSLPGSLLPRATSNWLKSKPTLDSLVRAFTPTGWASQCLGLNPVTALSTHLNVSPSKISAAQSQSLTTRSHVIGLPFRTIQPSPILDPCPGFLVVGAPVFT